MSVRDLLKQSRSKVHPCEITTGTVFVKTLSGAGRNLYGDLSKAAGGTLPLHTIVALAVCNEDGTMLFDCSTDKGVALANAELQDVDGIDLQKISYKLLEVSGLLKDAVSDAEKKSEASQTA